MQLQLSAGQHACSLTVYGLFLGRRLTAFLDVCCCRSSAQSLNARLTSADNAHLYAPYLRLKLPMMMIVWLHVQGRPHVDEFEWAGRQKDDQSLLDDFCQYIQVSLHSSESSPARWILKTTMLSPPGRHRALMTQANIALCCSCP